LDEVKNLAFYEAPYYNREELLSKSLTEQQRV
jgi:hypothetical protein